MDVNNLKPGSTLTAAAKINKRMETPKHSRKGHPGKKSGQNHGQQGAGNLTAGDRDTFSHKGWEAKTLWEKIKESNRKLRDAIARREPQQTPSPKIGLYTSNNVNNKKPVR